MSRADGKWWHVPDEQIEELVSDMAGSDPFGKRTPQMESTSMPMPTVVTAATRPPRPRVANSPRVTHSPRPPVANSPRPPVRVGAPLWTHRSCSPCPTPRTRPSSSPGAQCRNGESKKADGRIIVYVHNVHSSDKLVLRVHPDMRIGVGPSSVQPELGSGFTSLSHAASPDGIEETSSQPSVKSQIARALGINAGQIRLMLQGSPLGSDEKTLRDYGVSDESTLHLRIRRNSSVCRDELVLACAAKKYAKEVEQEKDENLCMRPYSHLSPSVRSRLDHRCAQNGAALMPKWVSQEHPKLFAPVGIGMDGNGGVCPFEAFADKGIWISPVDHPNQRGQNQYGLQRVREGAHAQYANRGGA